MRVNKYLVILLVLASFSLALEIEPDVLNELKNNEEVRVIVILEDPQKSFLGSLSEPTTIRERQDEVLQDLIVSDQPLSEEPDFELRHQYLTINGFSGNITWDGLQRLDPRKVKGVYLDRKVSATLDDTLGIIGGQFVHNASAGGYNLTGAGETICVLDSGIDYTRIALGNCNPLTFLFNGTNVSFTSESDHPYTNNLDKIFNITRPGYTQIAIHFKTIGLEAPAGGTDATDRIIVSDVNNNTIAVYKGNHTNVWSPSAVGDTLFVRLVSDSSVTDYGFLIDQVINGTTNETMNWTSCTKIVDGWDFVNTDRDPQDDYGHGTHIAGIVASNDSTYKGIAPDAKLVAMKVLDSSGNGFFSDVDAAIDWCTANQAKYNISVITMSLGTAAVFTTACGASFPSTKASVLAAVGQGITVIAASGNGGSSTGISSPGCLANVTSVGSTSNDDTVFSSSNGNSLLDLLAPGTSIRSVESSVGNACGAPGGDFGDCSGTSMSAPHVAGAAALLHQYWRLAYGKNITPEEVKVKFQRTGVVVQDTRNNLFFSRIDVFSAIKPFINFTPTSVLNNSIITANNTLLNISVDVNLSNAVLQWNYSNGSIRNFSMTKFNSTSWNFNITHLVDGVDRFKVYGNDTINTIGVSGEFSITIDGTVAKVTLNNPANGSVLGLGIEPFNVTILEANIDDVTFSFDNASGISFNLTPLNMSGVWNVDINLSRFVEGLHSLTILVNDTAGQTNNTQVLQFIVDRTAPNISIITPLAFRNFTIASSNQTFNLSIRDVNLDISSVKLSFTNSTGFNVTLVNQSGYWVASYNVSTLSEGGHLVRIFVNDTGGNMNASVTFSFTVDNSVPNVTYLTANALNFSKSSFNKTFNLSIGDATLSSVKLSFDNASGTAFNVTLVNQSGYWVTSYNVSTLAEGSHTVTLLSNDTHGNINNSEVLTFNTDYTFFTVNNLSSTGVDTNSADISWNSSELANSTVHYGITLALGSATSSTTRKQQHAITISSLTSSTTYFFNVTSCDFAGNCNTTNGTSFKTSTIAAAPGGGGGGGGGGGSSTKTVTKTVAASTESETTETAAESSGSATAGLVSPQDPRKFTTPVVVSSAAPTLVVVNREGIAFSEIVIKANVDKKVNVNVESVEKPAELPELSNVYQYLKIDSELANTEIDNVEITFSVPQVWLTSNNLDAETVVLRSYVGEEWVDTLTTRKMILEHEVIYTAQFNHLSYFAITAEILIEEVTESMFSKLLKKVNKLYLLVGAIFIVLLIIIITFIKLHKKQDVY